MPLKYFICPDSDRIETKLCLQHCRTLEECVTLPTRLEIVEGEREWTGVPHTTQLLNGLRLEWLRIKKDYATVPKARAFQLLGVSHHRVLGTPKSGLLRSWMFPELELSENELDHRISTIDLIETDPDNHKSYIITDYKTWGSYRVAKTLGIVKGAAKGTFITDPSQVDIKEVALQLNGYRIHAESSGYPISKMRVQITVRDGGLMMARQRGLEELMYMITIPHLVDDAVRSFYNTKAAELLQFLKDDIAPPVCTADERWDGTRCRDYCDLLEFCPEGKLFAMQKG